MLKTEDKKVFKKLYSNQIPSHRSGAIFNTHSYPTKINIAPVLSCILAHTKPGDKVLDAFAGSGSTGLATALAAKPTDDLKAFVEGLGLDVKWGARKGVLCDISTLSQFISATMLSSVDTEMFVSKANELIEYLESEIGWIYKAKDLNGEEGEIRFTLLSEVLECPECGTPETFFDNAVSFEPVQINERFTCSNCGYDEKLSKTPRKTVRSKDKLLGSIRTTRKREYVYLYGKTGSKSWKRQITSDDLKIVNKVKKIKIPDSVPVVKMLNRDSEKWGELHRKGYHLGVSHLHHFYTHRNLIALGYAWQFTNNIRDKKLRDALRLLISSYNASHSTLMTRVVCKKGAKDFVPTSGQPSVLYISSLPVEKNVIAGLRGKIKTFSKSFDLLEKTGNNVESICASCSDIPLKSGSIDYIFTDPPFGDNIQYSEVNFVSEAWIGKVTDAKDEAIVSKFNDKGVDEYRDLLNKSFKEYFRVLKKGKYLTLVFHNSKANIWEALKNAWEDAGFVLVQTSTLDKKQGSFKQVTTNFFVKGDCLLLLYKPSGKTEQLTSVKSVDYWDSVKSIIKKSDNNLSKQEIFNELTQKYLKSEINEMLDADVFYKELEKRYPEVNLQ